MDNAVNDLLHTKPVTRLQLAAWVQFFLGYTVQSVCRCIRPLNARVALAWEKEGGVEHQSQLDYLESSFLNQHSACVFMATRNGGKSLAAAVVDILDGWFKPGIKIAVVGFIDEHAQYIAKYIYKFLDHFERVIGRKVTEKRSDAAKVKSIDFLNGSIIRFFSGGKSEADVSGFRPHVIQVDEADKFAAEKFNGIGNALEGGGDMPSKFEVLSTNYTMDGDGVILKQIEKYETFNAVKPDHMLPSKVFRLCLLDILKNCDDRFHCDTCHLWSYCKGRAKEVRTDGYFRVEEAVQKCINTSRPNFEAEFLLLRPSSEYSYFPEFSVAEHVIEPDRPLDPTLLTLIAFDFGHGRCPQAATIVQKGSDGSYHVVDEFLRECDLEVFCDIILAKYPNATDFDCFFDPYGERKDSIRGSKSYSQVLKAKGFFPRHSALKRRPTFELLHMLIAPAGGKPKFSINKLCKHLIRQIQSAEHQVKSGKILPEPADGKGDDLLDCLRYIIGKTSSSTYAKHNGVRQLRWF